MLRLTRTQFAALLHVTVPQITQWEAGDIDAQITAPAATLAAIKQRLARKGVTFARRGDTLEVRVISRTG